MTNEPKAPPPTPAELMRALRDRIDRAFAEGDTKTLQILQEALDKADNA